MTRTIVRFYVTDVILKAEMTNGKRIQIKKDILINRRRVKGESPH